LHDDPSTTCREIRRNRGLKGYRYEQAHEKAASRKNTKPSTKLTDVLEATIIEKLNPIKKFAYTLTADNGKEFAYNQLVSLNLEADFYFANPYHSWERGLNEHTNGLIRQCFPKSQNLSEVKDADILRVGALLNNRPRKILDFETPLEAFERL